MNLFNSSSIPVLEQAINFAQARHSVLAGNIANMDTPGYRVRDLSVDEFQSRLKEAIEERDRTGPSVSAAEIFRNPDRDISKVKDSMRSILYHDESDVGLESQVLEISKNQSMHNMAIAIMSSQFRMLHTAISERV